MPSLDLPAALVPQANKMALVEAASTNANNGTNYSPATSGTDGNTSAIII